jgi:hypothetical protein
MQAKTGLFGTSYAEAVAGSLGDLCWVREREGEIKSMLRLALADCSRDEKPSKYLPLHPILQRKFIH